MSKADEARITIKSHQTRLPKFKLSMTLNKDHALEVIVLILKLKNLEETKSSKDSDL